MLPKYCIGDLALAPGEAPPTSYEGDLAEGQFYHTLKKRVDAYFRDHKARFKRPGCEKLQPADSPLSCLAAGPAHAPSHVCQVGVHPVVLGCGVVRRVLRLPGELRGTFAACASVLRPRP